MGVRMHALTVAWTMVLQNLHPHCSLEVIWKHVSKGGFLLKSGAWFCKTCTPTEAWLRVRTHENSTEGFFPAAFAKRHWMDVLPPFADGLVWEPLQLGG